MGTDRRQFREMLYLFLTKDGALIYILLILVDVEIMYVALKTAESSKLEKPKYFFSWQAKGQNIMFGLSPYLCIKSCQSVVILFSIFQSN